MELEINHRLITDPRSITEREMRRKKIIWRLNNMLGFPGGSVLKNLPANARDAGLIPGLGRFPGEGNDNPL